MRRSVLIIVVCLLTVVAGYAQDDAIRVATDLVSVPVSVLDRSGKYISTLTKGDFKVFEDGVEQQIDLFETIDQNVTVLMLLERTGSREFELATVVAAANAFVRQMRPEDSLMAMSFGTGTDTLIPLTKIKNAPKGVKVGRYANDRYTLLYEAVAIGIKRMAKIPGRKAIVLFSSGNDPEMFASSTFRSTLKDAEESDATIYTIKVESPQLPPTMIRDMTSYREKLKRNEEYMTQLAAKTGGRALRVAEIRNLDAAFADIAGELVRQYVLGYSPTKPGSNGDRRKIKVQVTVSDAIIRARKEVVFKQQK